MSRTLLQVLVALSVLLAVPASSLADRSGTRPNVISVPRGPGSIEGLGESFQVDLNSGSATESIGLRLPPGTGGFAPSLALAYNSGAGSGPVGLGWSLPVGTIQVQTEKGLPRYDGTDRFLYEGAELVGLPDGSFRLKNEGQFILARRLGEGWEVKLSSGVVRRFGFDAQARIEDGDRVFAWFVEDEIDLFGNRISYFYEKHDGQPYLVRILYNRRPGAADNRVEVEYEPRPDALADYKATFRIVQGRRLKAVRIYAAGAQVRRYALAYKPDVPLSLLSSVTMSGADDQTSLPALQLEYSSFEPAQKPVHTMGNAPASLPGASPDVELADVDGDGFPDLLVAQSGQHAIHRNRLGQEFDSRRALATSPAVALGTSGVDLADLNGDGLIDLVARTGSTAQAFRYFPNNGQGSWAPSVVFANNPSFAVEDGQTRWADLDHDKLPDAFRLNGSSATWWRNEGGGRWAAAAGLPLPPGETRLDFSDPRVKLADFNGDRLLDLAFVRSGSVLLWPAMGRGRFDAPVELRKAPAVGSANETRLQPVDLNADGLADLVFVDVDHLDYWLLLPSGEFSEKKSIDSTPHANLALTQVRLADMNGNGTVDVVWFTPTAAPDERVVYFDPIEGLRPNLLVEVRNGMGLVRELGYGSSGEQYQAALQAGRPWTTRLPFPVQLVSQTTLSDQRGGTYATRYRYADGYYAAQSREFRGFGWVEEREVGEPSDPSLVIEHEFDLGRQDEALKGRETRVAYKTDEGVLLQAVDREFGTRLYASGQSEERVAGAELLRAETRLYEAGNPAELLRETWTYDAFGNPLTHSNFGRVVGDDPLAGDDESIQTVTYANDAETWILGRAVEESISDGAGRVLSRARHYYDGEPFIGLPFGQLGRGVRTRTERWVEGERWSQEWRVERDDFGNLVAQLAPGGARHEVAFDATHTFPELERLQTGGGRVLEFRASYVPGRGLVTSFIDSDGATSRFAYDSLDRLVAIARPGDTLELPTLRFRYELSSPLSRLVREERPVSGEERVLQTLAYFDGLGREVAKVVQAEGGRWVVSNRREHSRRGGVLVEWDPYFADSERIDAAPASAGVRHAYDALGRKISSEYADGTRTRVDLGALWREEWDGEDLQSDSAHRGTPMRFESDGLGRTVRIVERLGTQELSTRFVYDALGQRVGVVDARGGEAKYGFDGLGRVREVRHPDAGTQRYEYDADGNVLRWHDAAGRRVERDFDAAGRILAERLVDAAGSVTGRMAYHYDEPSPRLGGGTSANGRLSWVEDPAGEEHFLYDERGRLARSLRSFEGRDYALEQRYDNLDRVVGLTYPDGLELEYRYNERGLLESVPRVVSEVEYNAFGLAVRRVYANGVVSRAGYDEHERVKQLKAEERSGRALQELSYIYDRAGTLLSIEDRAHPKGGLSATRGYGYDDLYRLTNVKSPVSSWSFDYDALGNLLQKSDVGVYAYGAEKPNAVQSVAGRPIKYDANGSVTESWGRVFEYDPRGLLRKVTGENGAVTEYLYDYEGQRTVKRVQAVGSSKTVLYLDRFAEIRDGESVNYVFAGDARLARVGGGTPKPLALIESALRGVGRALALLGLIPLALGMVLLAGGGRRRRGAVGLIAAGMALLMASCGPGTQEEQGPLAGTIFYVGDHLGSAELLTDTSGKVVGESSYDPWGLQVVATDEPYGFTDKEWDAEAGLYYFGNRYYDPRIGRFLSVDLAALNAPELSIEDPQLLNPYAYARNTPTSLRDRDGNFAHVAFGALIGAVVGGGIYLVKAAINDDYQAKGLLGAVVGGAAAGAVGAATFGVSLAAGGATGAAGMALSGAMSSTAGGIVDRGISTGSVSAALDFKEAVHDAAMGGAFGMGAKAVPGLRKVVTDGARKVAGGAKSRMGSTPREAAKGCGNACKTGGCFVAGTLVLLASGALLPIEQIEVGDRVVAPASLESPREYAPYEVLETPRRTVAEVLDILLEHEDGRRELLTATDEHPFAVEREAGPEWVVARELRAGDRVVTDEGAARVQSVARRVAPTEVFNLVVESAHAYLVGDGVLVHNGDGYAKAAADVTFSRGRFPKSSQHIEDAQASGRPSTLTIDRNGAAARRRGSLRETKRQPGLDRDEYPPAMFKEGGEGASVRPITPSDNRGAGACIGAQCRDLPDGTRVNIRVTE